MAYKNGDISIMGRFWSESDKIIDASQIDGFNLENGDGKHSLKQVLSDDGTRINIASGDYSVALGQQGKAYGRGSISLGNSSKAGYTYEEWLVLKGLDNTEENHANFLGDSNNRYQVVIGQSTIALGKDSFAGGHSAIAKGDMSFAFGVDAGSKNSELIHTTAEGYNSFALGKGVKAVGDHSFAIGETTNASNKRSVAIGYATSSSGENSFAGGYDTVAEGENSFAFGYQAKANNDYAISLGYQTLANGNRSIVLGNNSIASNTDAIAIGRGSKATGSESIAIGWQSIYYNNSADGTRSLALGVANRVGTEDSISIGYNNKTAGTKKRIFQLGSNLTSEYEDTIALGHYNDDKYIDDKNKGILLSVGNGTASARSNAFEVLRDGSANIKSHLKVGGYATVGNVIYLDRYTGLDVLGFDRDTGKTTDPVFAVYNWVQTDSDYGLDDGRSVHCFVEPRSSTSVVRKQELDTLVERLFEETKFNLIMSGTTGQSLLNKTMPAAGLSDTYYIEILSEDVTSYKVISSDTASENSFNLPTGYNRLKVLLTGQTSGTSVSPASITIQRYNFETQQYESAITYSFDSATPTVQIVSESDVVFRSK